MGLEVDGTEGEGNPSLSSLVCRNLDGNALTNKGNTQDEIHKKCFSAESCFIW